ncbi:MAG TPA: zf-HC2 domain-containing protein [Longimicrobiales bacterium]|nr:zf-HC2 domain-containing protein [Longimicrobiales bacterium]
MIPHDELMRYLDGELPPERAREVERAMETSTELRRDFLLYGRMKTDLQALGEQMETHGTVWSSVSRAIVRPVGWILFLVGTAIWLAYGIYAYLTSAESLVEKLVTGGIAVGLAMLLLSALLDRLQDLRSDPYRGIQQ